MIKLQGRLKRVYVSSRRMMLNQDPIVGIGLPNDARTLFSEFEPSGNRWLVIVKSEEFDDIAYGEEIPIFVEPSPEELAATFDWL